MKGSVSAQKALQGSLTKTRELQGGMKGNNVLPNVIFHKKETEKELGVSQTFSGSVHLSDEGLNVLG